MRSNLLRAIKSTGKRRWPEMVVGLLACLILLGSLGTLELWGKREQRAAATALDMVENGRWLVAQIQGRPRLEKPPLPSWAAATFMTLTGRRDEWLVRLPSALSGLATVCLVYSLGRKMGGRTLGLAAAMILCTTGLFVSELRQAGSDGPLGLFTTLALYAAWRRLDGTMTLGHASENRENAGTREFRGWTILFHVALGLGFLCKGPIILLLVGITVVPTLVVADRLRPGLRQLFDPLGLVLFLGLSLAWPVPVLLKDPHALGVWITEMGQKTGILPIGHQHRDGLGLELPLLALPWAVVAMVGVLLPVVANRRVILPWKPSAVIFAWWWSIGNLGMFSLWMVAKPNYYVPCLPGLALLGAMAWTRLSRVARDLVPSRAGSLARGLLVLQSVILLACGVALPLLSRQYLTAPPVGWLVLIAVLASSGVVLGFWIWRRGSNILALVPFTAACALGVLIGYGVVAGVDNPVRGHHRLAEELERLVPPTATTVRFFHEIDEGLWFYLRSHRLAPVPGSQPQYSKSYDSLDSLMSDGSVRNAPGDPFLRPKHQAQVLVDWLRAEGQDEPYLLMRSTVYERMSACLEGRVTPVYQEAGMTRNSLVLLHVKDAGLRMASERSGGDEVAPR